MRRRAYPASGDARLGAPARRGSRETALPAALERRDGSKPDALGVDRVAEHQMCRRGAPRERAEAVRRREGAPRSTRAPPRADLVRARRVERSGRRRVERAAPIELSDGLG